MQVAADLESPTNIRPRRICLATAASAVVALVFSGRFAHAINMNSVSSIEGMGETWGNRVGWSKQTKYDSVSHERSSKAMGVSRRVPLSVSSKRVFGLGCILLLKSRTLQGKKNASLL